MNQSINQSTIISINDSSNRTIHHPFFLSFKSLFTFCDFRLVHYSINPSISQSINQSANPSNSHSASSPSRPTHSHATLTRYRGARGRDTKTYTSTPKHYLSIPCVANLAINIMLISDGELRRSYNQ